MSLDVYLRVPGGQVPQDGPRIFVREDGQTKLIPRAEWDASYPDREPVTVAAEGVTNMVYSANITHNLGRMAEEADMYGALWRPEEAGITTAAQLIAPLTAGLARLQAEPAHYQTFAPANGWGDYAGLVHFVMAYLAACRAYPEATVSVSR